jgi:hypothetical protein
MKTPAIHILVPTLLLGASLAFAPTFAHAEEAEAKVVIPAKAAEIWRAIDHHIADLHATIDKGKLDNVHVHAFAVRDLVRALPMHSPHLSADALTKVKAQSKFVDTLATRLDQTGDAGDKPGTIANVNKLEGVLKSIRAAYPASGQ